MNFLGIHYAKIIEENLKLLHRLSYLQQILPIELPFFRNFFFAASCCLKMQTNISHSLQNAKLIQLLSLLSGFIKSWRSLDAQKPRIKDLYLQWIFPSENLEKTKKFCLRLK